MGMSLWGMLDWIIQQPPDRSQEPYGSVEAFGNIWRATVQIGQGDLDCSTRQRKDLPKLKPRQLPEQLAGLLR
jgi:hypothetical protein